MITAKPGPASTCDTQPRPATPSHDLRHPATTCHARTRTRWETLLGAQIHSVQSEHFPSRTPRKLAPITNQEEAAELFQLAPSQTPDEFSKTVDRYRIAKDSQGWRARQRAARTLRFFKADDGCVGFRGILPTLEGERIKAAINQACDNAWRAAHPERAETSGAHNDEPRERRLADALVSLVLGDPSTATGGPARTALIVTVQAETLEAHILGNGPLPTDDAIGLADDARTDLYAAIQTTNGAILKFGRSRRLASALQKLALALREHGTCAYPGCTTTWQRCDADHDPPWDQGGLTNIDKMKLMCTNGHHTHRHETGKNITRQPNGTWTVNNEPNGTWTVDNEPIKPWTVDNEPIKPWTVNNEPIKPWPPPPPGWPPDDDDISIAHAREACLARLRQFHRGRSPLFVRAGP